MADEPSLEELLAGRDRRAEDQATWDEFVSLFEAGGAGEVPAPADGGAGPVDERPGRPPSQAWASQLADQPAGCMAAAGGTRPISSLAACERAACGASPS